MQIVYNGCHRCVSVARLLPVWVYLSRMLFSLSPLTSLLLSATAVPGGSEAEGLIYEQGTSRTAPRGNGVITNPSRRKPPRACANAELTVVLPGRIWSPA